MAVKLDELTSIGLLEVLFQNDCGIDALLESNDDICRRYSARALGNIVNSFANGTVCENGTYVFVFVCLCVG